MYESIKHEFESLVKESVQENYGKSVSIPIEEPPDEIPGIIATPVAYKINADAPTDAAETLKSSISTHETQYIEEIDSSGPYLNAIPKDSYYSETIEYILEESYKTKEPLEIVVEHTSANPTGPLHVGSARNAYIGNSIAKSLELLGHSVTVQYYVNNIGLQVALLTWAYDNFDEPAPGMDNDALGYYKKANQVICEDDLRSVIMGEKNKQPESDVVKTLQKIESGDKENRQKMMNAVSEVVNLHIETLSELGITVDEIVYESEYLDSGDVDELLAELCTNPNSHPITVDTDSGELSLTRSDGTSLYASRDIAFHSDKLNTYDLAVTVMGKDHEEHAKKLTDILSQLGHDTTKLNIVTHEFVDTPEGSMAKRDGTAVYIDDVISELECLSSDKHDIGAEEMLSTEIAKGAFAYELLSKQPSKGITFDLEESIDISESSGPSAQYAYTRALSILESADYTPCNISSPVTSYDYHESSKKLLIHLSKFGKILNDVAYNNQPQSLVKYLESLVTYFNHFYRDCQVIDNGTAINERLAIVYTVKIVLENIFSVLTIPDTKEM